MSHKKIIRVSAAFTLFLGLDSAHAQGTFQNLNFEMASPVVIAGAPLYPDDVTVTSAVPYWTVNESVDGAGDSMLATEALYGTVTLGGTSLTLIGPATQYGPPAIDGDYSVYLQTYAPNNWVSISQTGQIPEGAEGLLFKGAGGELADLSVQVGTQAVPFSAVGSGSNYTLFEANISAWAGDTEKITFTGYSSGEYDAWELDDISFSAAPEPSVVALAVMGGLIIWVQRWFTRSRLPKSPIEVTFLQL